MGGVVNYWRRQDPKNEKKMEGRIKGEGAFLEGEKEEDSERPGGPYRDNKQML
jgi:hypothetical protein